MWLESTLFSTYLSVEVTAWRFLIFIFTDLSPLIQKRRGYYDRLQGTWLFPWRILGHPPCICLAKTSSSNKLRSQQRAKKHINVIWLLLIIKPKFAAFVFGFCIEGQILNGWVHVPHTYCLLGSLQDLLEEAVDLDSSWVIAEILTKQSTSFQLEAPDMTQTDRGFAEIVNHCEMLREKHLDLE